MTLPSADKIEASAHVLRHEIEKLDGLGLTFAASMVRIAHLDLQMRPSFRKPTTNRSATVNSRR